MAKRGNATITEIKASHLAFMSNPRPVADVVVEKAIKGLSK